MPKPLPRRDISRLYTSNSYRDSATPYKLIFSLPLSILPLGEALRVCQFMPRDASRYPTGTPYGKRRQQGAIAILVGMNVEPFNGDYKTLYERVAKDTQAYLIPEVLASLNNPRYLYDRIHPNQAGHRIIANRIAQRLNPLLEQATLPPNLSKLRQSRD